MRCNVFERSRTQHRRTMMRSYCTPTTKYDKVDININIVDKTDLFQPSGESRWSLRAPGSWRAAQL